ncbi:MAG: glycosyltransferase family 4 protein [Chthoniobacterales bacterium]
MKRRAFFFRIGAFSLINDSVAAGLRTQLPGLDWCEVDVERDIVRRSPLLVARATAEALLRYGDRIVSNRQPPRDYYSRIPAVIEAVRTWVWKNVAPAETALVFQTQSLFDARHPEVPHFLYTDHTYLANRRYPQPKPQLPVPGAWLEMERALYAGAACNFVSSGFAAESLREDYGIPAERVDVVHSGSNIAVCGDEAERSGRVILFVGVDWERKGGPELVEAFHEVRAGIPDAELWIAGCSPPVSGPGIKVLGRMSPGKVAECYRKADVFCLPSRMDPSASVLAEAAAHGLPVVATRVGGNVERVEDGVTGFLCETGELSRRLAELLKSPELRRQFGEAGRHMVNERFTWDAVCGRMAHRMRMEIEQ